MAITRLPKYRIENRTGTVPPVAAPTEAAKAAPVLPVVEPPPSPPQALAPATPATNAPKENPYIQGFRLADVSDEEHKRFLAYLDAHFGPALPHRMPSPLARTEINASNVDLQKSLEPFRMRKHLDPAKEGGPRIPDLQRFSAWYWASVEAVALTIQRQDAPYRGERERRARATAQRLATAAAAAAAAESAPPDNVAPPSAPPAPAAPAPAAHTIRPTAVTDNDLHAALLGATTKAAEAQGQPANLSATEAQPIVKISDEARTAARRRENAPPALSSWELAPVLLGFYAIAEQGVLVHAQSLKAIAFRDFETQYSGILPKGTVRALMADPEFQSHRCISTRYEPGKPITFELDGDQYFNTYRPVEYEAKQGPITPLANLLSALLAGDLDSARHVVNILAFLVQRPGQRLGYAPCFVTGASVNKELLQGLLVTLLGDKNTFVPDGPLFTSQFNDWVRRTSIVILNQVSTTKAYQEKMAHLVTAPELAVSLKGSNTDQVPNRLNVIAFARELGDLEHFSDPRRLGVFDMSEEPVSSQTYNEFKSWLEGDGKSHLLFALRAHDLSAFDPRQAPVNVRAQEQLDILSRSPILDYLQEALTAHRAPMKKDLVNVNDLTDALLRVGQRAVTTADVRKALQEMGAVHVGQVRGVEGQTGKPNFWAVRRQQFWATQPEGVKRAYLAGLDDDGGDNEASAPAS